MKEGGRSLSRPRSSSSGGSVRYIHGGGSCVWEQRVFQEKEDG